MGHAWITILLGLGLLAACLWLRPGRHPFPHPDRGRECSERPEAQEYATVPLIPVVICARPYAGSYYP